MNNDNYYFNVNDIHEIQNLINNLGNSTLNINNSDNRFIIQFEFQINQPNVNEEENMPNYFKNHNHINNNLGKATYIKNNDECLNDKQCLICLEKFEHKKYKRVVKCCNNTYHKTCIDKWLKKNSTCPACRNDFLNKKDKESNN